MEREKVTVEFQRLQQLVLSSNKDITHGEKAGELGVSTGQAEL